MSEQNLSSFIWSSARPATSSNGWVKQQSQRPGRMLHMVFKVLENGVTGFVLAKGSMPTNTEGEGEIRQKLVDNDLVDCAPLAQMSLAA